MTFTVVNTFTLKDPAGAEEFERRFLSHVEWMRARPGFVTHQAVRSADRPEVYVNLGRWSSAEDFQQVLAHPVFQEHAAEFHRIVDVDADPSAELLRRTGAAAGPGDALLVEYVTVTGDTAAFEAAYRAYAEAAAAAEGFVGAELAKSLFARPGGYTAATRWRGTADREAARSLPEYAAVTALAEVRAVPATHVAGNGVPLAPAGA
ncbi:antibiotic biosynthesis monooxygenase family protein [Streptomyces sp. NPDC007100]|uniref:antibiotic biosynthesis monooxygenase family protein n=1 Tax=Streptomyces sp. NPDC007100 TaxID=3155602 RepID=UPI0033C25217